MANNKLQNTFTQINNKWWGIGLDPYEILIVAKVASWQRAEKEFYQSKQSIAEDFCCNTKTIKNKFKDLVDRNILIIVGKHKRMTKYKINEVELSRLIDQKDMGTTCPHSSRYGHQVPYIEAPHAHYNNTKTSTKTSLEEEDDILSSSSSETPEEPKLPITEQTLQELINDIK